MQTTDLPTLNAALNATAGVFLLLGWMAIKRGGDRTAHIRWMVAALVTSTVFLASYFLYHYAHGSTAYQGEGWLRVVYFFILITHIPLAGLVVPFCLVAVWHAIRGNLDRHVRIVRWLWPVWMYVSVTGVLIYLMLHAVPVV